MATMRIGILSDACIIIQMAMVDVSGTGRNKRILVEMFGYSSLGRKRLQR